MNIRNASFSMSHNKSPKKPMKNFQLTSAKGSINSYLPMNFVQLEGLKIWLLGHFTLNGLSISSTTP